MVGGNTRNRTAMPSGFMGDAGAMVTSPHPKAPISASGAPPHRRRSVGRPRIDLRPSRSGTTSSGAAAGASPPKGWTNVPQEAGRPQGDHSLISDGQWPWGLIDTPLVREAQSGDGRALGELLRRVRPVVEHAVGRRYPERDRRDDLVQATLIIVMSELGDLRVPEAFIRWVQGIACNVCRKEVRGRWALQNALARMGQPASGQNIHVLDPEAMAVQMEVRAHLRRALEALPTQHRRTVILRSLHGYSYQDIGDFAGMPTELARLWFFRGRQRLRALCMSDDVLARPGVA
jgi:RNA polymerase sigma factor (sigma-70 family)